MRDDDKALRSAAVPAGRGSSPTPSGCSNPPALGPTLHPTLGPTLGRRILAFAFHAPLWTYIGVAVIGLAVALVIAGLRG